MTLLELLKDGHGVDDMVNRGHSLAAISNAVDTLLSRKQISVEQRNIWQSIIQRRRQAA